jgi:hypothetical protein
MLFLWPFLNYVKRSSRFRFGIKTAFYLGIERKTSTIFYSGHQANITKFHENGAVPSTPVQQMDGGGVGNGIFVSIIA